MLTISIPMRMRRCNVGCITQMVHIVDFTRSHWTTPLGECLRHIASLAAMVNKFFENTKHYQKTTFS